jgi:hypothetical protein
VFFSNTAQAGNPANRFSDNPNSPEGRSKPMNNDTLKAGALGLYALTILSLLVNLPGGGILRTIVLIVLLAHIVEIIVFQKQIRLYQGPLVDSIGLTLLFGFMHWKPLADKAKRESGN